MNVMRCCACLLFLASVDVTEAQTPLFTNTSDFVDFNDVTAGSYLDGTQYDALGGDDQVVLPFDAAEATEAGYDFSTGFRAGAGHDVVSGGTLSDCVAPGPGNDLVTSGLGDDESWVGRGDGANTVVDDSGGFNRLVLFHGFNDPTNFFGVGSDDISFVYDDTGEAVTITIDNDGGLGTTSTTLTYDTIQALLLLNHSDIIGGQPPTQTGITVVQYDWNGVANRFELAGSSVVDPFCPFLGFLVPVDLMSFDVG